MIGRAFVIVVLLAAACSSDPAPSTTTVARTSPSVTTTTATTTTETPTTTMTSPTTEPTTRVPASLADFRIDSIELDDRTLTVAIADTPELRQQGLMGVEDLLDLDGMLFVFDRDVGTGFWMKNTVIDLDIAFFATSGEFVDGFSMEPCDADPCPVYRPSGSYRYALEMAAGDLPAVVEGLVP